MTAALLPSAAAVTVAWLKANTDLAVIHGGRVGTKLNATLPAIRVQRIGGTPAEPWRDDPAMQIECWAATEGAAENLCLTVRDAIEGMRGATLPTGKIVTFTVGPMYPMPDDPSLSNNSRYILTLTLLTTR